MEVSTLDKIEKGGPRLIKWFLVFALVLVLVGGVFLLYKNSGYEEYKVALLHLNSLSGDEKDWNSANFYGDPQDTSVHGGILAATWNYGILMWGKSGLTYFSINKASQFFTILGCTSENPNSTPAGTNPYVITDFSNIKDWRSTVHAGSYIIVKIITGNTSSLVFGYPDFRASDTPWVFCSLTLPDQSQFTN